MEQLKALALEHRGLLGRGLMALGICIACWTAIDGSMWVRGEDPSYLKASLLQIKQCEPGFEGASSYDRESQSMKTAGSARMICSGVHDDAVMRPSGWYTGFRYALLGSLACVILGIASWGSNRLSPDTAIPLPEPTVAKAVLLFVEVLALGLVLLLFTPPEWSIGGGYVVFLLGSAAVIGGGLWAGVGLVRRVEVS